MSSSKPLAFLPREFKGSRLRCLLLTHRSKVDMAKFFNSLVTPAAVVTNEIGWAPRGFLHPDEAKIGETSGFLTDDQRGDITNWWLTKPGRANTPNWDLVCKCMVGDRPGLILVEAKAHENEMKSRDDISAAKGENAASIAKALSQATAGWNAMMPGFNLMANSHYQLSNRFAFAWKLATMKIPVILVYLGFLDADEMSGRKLRDHAQWRKCVVDRSKGVIPAEAWDRTFDIDGTPLTVLIRSAKVRIEASLATTGETAP